MDNDNGSDNENDKGGAARSFDIRRIIGGLFLLYGLVLLVVGLLDGEAASEKAAGIDINIWTGLGMAVFGAAFLGWMLARPLQAEPVAPTEPDDHDARRS